MNGGWHELYLQIETQQISMIVDGSTTILSNLGLPSSFGRVIYFGQSPASFAAILVGTTLSYQGCIQNITINQQRKMFGDARRTSFSAPLPKPGCSADKCSGSNVIGCLNNGYCIGNNTGMFCNCLSGYTGSKCEKCTF